MIFIQVIARYDFSWGMDFFVSLSFLTCTALAVSSFSIILGDFMDLLSEKCVYFLPPFLP